MGRLKEHLFFHDGMNRKRDPLLLGEAEAHTISGVSWEKDGVLEPRNQRSTTYTITTLAYNQGIARYEDNVYAFNDHMCYGQANNQSAWTAAGLSSNFFNHIYRRASSSSTYSKIGVSRGSDRAKIIGYKEFAFYQDDDDLFALDDQYVFPWRIPNPTMAPVLIESSTGAVNFSASDVYSYKYTYTIEFPNGQIVETGPSPAASITLATGNMIEVYVPEFNVHLCRDNLTIRTKLYRTTESGAIYYYGYYGTTFTPIPFPTNGLSYPYPYYNTYFLDSQSDTNLITRATLDTTLYEPIPTGMNDIELYMQKIFAVKDDRLYWSEDYLPFNWMSASNYLTVSRDGEDLVCVVAWGDRLWMASKARWYSLVGSDDATWAIRETWTDKGVVNRNTVQRTEYGILGLSYEGICLFNGYNSKCITADILGKEYFDDFTNLTHCFSDWDGRKYYLFYDTSGEIPTKGVILDFVNYPKIRAYEKEVPAYGQYYHVDSGISYRAVYGTEILDTYGYEQAVITWQTREVVFGDPSARKFLEELHYDIDCTNANGSVSIAIYADGSLAQTLAITNTSRKRDMVKLGRIEGYRFYLIVTATAVYDMNIYEPITLVASIAGTS